MSELLLRVFLIVAPMYMTNASALFFGGKRALDFNRKFFDRKPILGKGKTIEGTTGGIIVGVLSTAIIQMIAGEQAMLVAQDYMLFGTLLTLGAIAGDITASFFKRRAGKARGSTVPLLDQLDFIVGGIVFAGWIYFPSIQELAAITVLTLVLHVSTNYIAFRLKLKSVPW